MRPFISFLLKRRTSFLTSLNKKLVQFNYILTFIQQCKMDFIHFKNLARPFPYSFEEKNNVINCRLKCMLSILFIFFQLNLCSAQPSQIKRTWHWYFGSQAGIDFSSGTAVADTNGALVTNEGCASISDTAGNLQFYSDGRTVWNRNHQVMPNGTGILGGANGSSTQQALIIPKPLSPNIYYLFTTDEAENIGVNGMRYTVVDMNLNGGMGDVDVTQKNILLFAPCTEKLAAVNHCNDSSVWVMGHEVNNNHFRAYLVTANGVDTNAVVSSVGHEMKNNGGMQGCMRFSPDGRKICFASDSLLGRVELAYFNNFTGMIHDEFTVLLTTNYKAIICFSPSGDRLYIGNNIFQYDLTSNDSSIIVLSQDNVFGSTVTSSALQHTFNGQIISHHIGIAINDSTLDLIQNPNDLGLNCNFIPNYIHVGTWQLGSYSLPNFNESYFRLNTNSVCVTGISDIEAESFLIYPNPGTDWITIRGNGIKEIAIFDLLGNLCYKAAGDFVSPQHINISILLNGIYVVQISSANQIIQKKLIKH